MKRASPVILAIALGALVSASKCEPDPPPAEPRATDSAAVGADERLESNRAGSDAGRKAPPGERDLLLAELSSRLDKVQVAGGQVHVVTGGGIALEPLLGMTRSELRSALGAPRACDEGSVAPCQTDDDWFYSFYFLPAGTVGGGPELLLQFDDRGTCVSARWMFTQ